MTTAGVTLAQRSLAAVVGHVMADPERLSPSEWAERHYRITDQTGAALPGAFRFSVTPYLRAIVDAFADPVVRRIVTMKREQVGGTETSIIMALYALAGADGKGGNMFWIWANKDNASDFNTRRFRPSMLACAPVARHMTGRKADARSLDVSCNGRTVWFRGAPPNEGGIRSLESNPARVIFNDELDRCDVNTPAVMLGRSTTFKRSYKHVFIGTPGDADEGIHKLYTHTAGGGMAYWVPCPFCGAWFVRDFSGVRWLPGARGGRLDADPEVVRKQAWYECPRDGCNNAIHAHHSRDMLAKGRWAPGWSEERPARVQIDERKGQLPPQEEIDAALHAPSIGFAIGEFENPFQPNPYGEIAAEYVQNRGEATKDWMTRRRGKPWRESVESLKSTALLSLCRPVVRGGYRFGVVPRSTSVLLGAIDVQGDRVYAQVNGFTPRMRRSWLVWCGAEKFRRPGGIEANYDVVEELTRRVYPVESDGGTEGQRDKEKTGMVASGWAIDSGYETRVVYDLCRRLGGVKARVYPVKGLEGDPSRGDDSPLLGLDADAAGKALPREMQTLWLAKVNTWRWKDWVMERLKIAVTRSGAAGNGGAGGEVEGLDEAGDEREMGDLNGLATALMYPEAVTEQGAGLSSTHERMRVYFESVTSEKKKIIINKQTGKPKRLWVVESGTEGAVVGNHYLDLTVYVHYLATLLRVPRMLPVEEGGKIFGRVAMTGGEKSAGGADGVADGEADGGAEKKAVTRRADGARWGGGSDGGYWKNRRRI